ncbi:MAG: serine/threonine protein kinase, partial [Oscillochloris sp.]|nr:serine/threonine protein kinase [Oscillochloris sp.]
MAFPNSSVARSGRYSQILLIGQGGCGNVYRVFDSHLGRMVAIKEASAAHPGSAERFKKEAGILALLNHPHIIQVYDLEEDQQEHALYMICEYANGGSLADHLRIHGPLPEGLAIQITQHLCAALAAAWSKRIVHRDIKPSNILLVRDEHDQIVCAKLADFGVARDLNRQPTTIHGGGHPGTPEYMAPEQADSAKLVDVRTDLYALGICLWEMLTGTDYKQALAAGPPSLQAINPQASHSVAEV